MSQEKILNGRGKTEAQCKRQAMRWLGMNPNRKHAKMTTDQGEKNYARFERIFDQVAAAK
jgi:hypothetical protein